MGGHALCPGGTPTFYFFFSLMTCACGVRIFRARDRGAPYRAHPKSNHRYMHAAKRPTRVISPVPRRAALRTRLRYVLGYMWCTARCPVVLSLCLPPTRPCASQIHRRRPLTMPCPTHTNTPGPPMHTRQAFAFATHRRLPIDCRPWTALHSLALSRAARCSATLRAALSRAARTVQLPAAVELLRRIISRRRAPRWLSPTARAAGAALPRAAPPRCTTCSPAMPITRHKPRHARGQRLAHMASGTPDAGA
jgi:hypothetical protein